MIRSEIHQEKIETAKSKPMSLDLDTETPKKEVEKVPAAWLQPVASTVC